MSIDSSSSNSRLLIKNKWTRAILFTISGLMIGYGNWSVKDPAKAWTLMTGGCVLLAPLLSQVPNQETK